MMTTEIIVLTVQLRINRPSPCPFFASIKSNKSASLDLIRKLGAVMAMSLHRLGDYGVTLHHLRCVQSPREL